jgi:AraC-like DNA-binding protein
VVQHGGERRLAAAWMSSDSVYLNAHALPSQPTCVIVQIMSGDPFSDVLRLTEATSIVSGGFSAGGAWALRFPPPDRLKYSAIARGSCWLQVDGQKKPVELFEGDVFLLAGGRGFVVASDPSVKPKEAYSVLGERRLGAMARIGDGAGCTVIAGNVSLHPASGDLLRNVLPPVAIIRAGAPEAAALRWIMEQLLVEYTTARPGATVAIAQLAQLMFVQLLRAHLAASARLPVGWLRAIRDERLAPALRLLHAEPGRDWKLPELARAVGMSRTAFAVHFKATAGIAPLAYLTTWRMRLAERTLREEDATVSEIAASLGYTSESAFSSAFKRVTGSAPRHYRQRSREASPAA